MIWKECLPQRVVEISVPIYFGFPEGECQRFRASNANSSPPAICSVNSEAREVALKYCNQQSDNERRGLPRRDLHPREILPFPQMMAIKPGPWFNPSKDTPVLYHKPRHPKTPAVVSGRATLYGQLVQETGVVDPIAQPWPHCQDPACQLRHGLPAMPACGWRDPLIVVDIISIHASNEWVAAVRPVWPAG